ncbi:MAG: hypothetical protein RUMPE_01157 [Eubacteriales bacterium SKADARSKE-1]|nr:hypothetical protein [Eubacteriales bacterium SKADARSKE-1]
MDKNRFRDRKIRYTKVIFVFILVGLYLFSVGIFLKKGVDLCYECIYSILNEEGFYPGIYINGIDMGGKTKKQAKLILSERLNLVRPNIDIKVICEDKTILLTAEDFNYNYNVDETVDLIYFITREGSPLLRYSTAMLIKNNPIFFNVLAVPTKDSIDTVIDNISLNFDDKVQEPHVSCFNPLKDPMFTYEAGKDGLEVNRFELRNKIESALKSGVKSDIFIKRQKVTNTVAIEDVKRQIGLISEFITTVSNNYSRNNNIKMALSFINGTVLTPGETFSFNKIVGNTNLPSRGFVLAPALSNGVSVTAYGGGVCQVASTVYGAAIRANMTIMERYNHSLKSKYVPIGQDATVSYNSADLKFKNLLNGNVYICTYLNGYNVICRFYGTLPRWYDKIEVVSGYAAGSSNKVFAQRVFYKKGMEVYREALPASTYKQ